MPDGVGGGDLGTDLGSEGGSWNRIGHLNCMSPISDRFWELEPRFSYEEVS